MYDALIMLDNADRLTFETFVENVRKAAAAYEVEVAEGETLVTVSDDCATLRLSWEESPHVVVESNEIAEQFGGRCENSARRIVTHGDDPDMELFNVWLFIVQDLQERPGAFAFDPDRGLEWGSD